MKNRFGLVCIVLSLIVLSGCNGCQNPLMAVFGIKEGIIEYDAVPLDQENSMASLAPSKMTLKFKDDKISYGFTAGMGMFTMSLISDPDKMTVTQIVRVLNQKWYHPTTVDELKQEYSVLPKYTITETNETKEIAGYKCKKAVVKYDNDVRPSYDLYYTNDIKVKNPNWSTPFPEIDGMLMEYQVERFGLEMKFTAKTVTKTPVEEATFQIPEGYKKVSKKEMDDFFKSFQ